MVPGMNFGEYMFAVYDAMSLYVDFNDDDDLGPNVATAIHECWERGTDVETAADMLDMKFSEDEEDEDDKLEDDGP